MIQNETNTGTKNKYHKFVQPNFHPNNIHGLSVLCVQLGEKRLGAVQTGEDCLAFLSSSGSTDVRWLVGQHSDTTLLWQIPFFITMINIVKW